MPRKILITAPGKTEAVLTEIEADNELQLQEQLRRHPEVLPLADLDLREPLLVVGRETRVESGAVDLIGLTAEGQIAVIEFKTGPGASHFRGALAQVLDYGASLSGMSYHDFEQHVVIAYLRGNHCDDARIRGKQSIKDAASTVWGSQELHEDDEPFDLQSSRAGSRRRWRREDFASSSWLRTSHRR